MSRLEIHMNDFKRVFKKCEPELETDNCEHLIRTECILHKYLGRTTIGRRTNPAGCIGGPICVEITEKLGLCHQVRCEDIHKMVYDLIKKKYRETVKI
jgi:hypothetical protein